MDRLIIEKYIRDNKRVSIPEIQFKFSLTYKETRMLFQELENKKVIKPEDDIYYTVLSQEKAISPSDREQNEQEDEEEWVFNDDEEDEEESDDEEETDDDDTVLYEPKEVSLEDIKKRRTLVNIVTSFGCSGEFTRVGEEYYCALGVVYPNDVPMTFKLSYKDKILLSDDGLTHKYISTYFDMADSNVQELIEKIMQEYNLIWITEGQTKELAIHIRDKEGAFISFLCFFSAIERISHISAEKWYKINSEKEEAFCKEETLKILFEQEATYEAAIQTAKNLYAQAQEEGDEFKKHAYKTMVEMFEGIGFEDFEYFKQCLLEEENE